MAPHTRYIADEVKNSMAERTLTDADIDALVTKLEKSFYESLGKNVWSAAWKIILSVIIGIAAYGKFRG